MTEFENISAMPAPTWHFLKANDTQIEIPDGLTISPCVEANVPDNARGTADALERALTAAQTAWEETHPAPTAEELAERAAFLAAEADATYGGTAQSTYQARADALEEARSLAAAFEHGTGDAAASFLRDAAGERIVICGDASKTVGAQVIVNAVPAAINVAAIDIVAGPRSTVSLSLVVSAPESSKGVGALGIAGTTVRVFADADSRVSVIRTQALDEAFTDIDDMALFTADSARIDVRQTVLGGSRTFTGLAGDLRGVSSEMEVDTHYLGHGEQMHDFNYALRHHGPKTRCNLQANGVLAGKSRKTLRGTIDLVRGCKGAEGTGNETVLLVDDGVRNKTVPVILCNEDDVAGNHGATIGHIREEQMFYLATRGLSQEAAERMFVGAVLERAAIDAPDEASRTAVLRLGAQLQPGFAELFEE